MDEMNINNLHSADYISCSWPSDIKKHNEKWEKIKQKEDVSNGNRLGTNNEDSEVMDSSSSRIDFNSR